MKFTDFWKKQYLTDRIEKKLSQKELKDVRDVIASMAGNDKPAKKIITSLSRKFDELKEPNRAKQAYVTESKRIESKYIKESSVDLGMKKFRIQPSNKACDDCLNFTKDGKRVFYQKGLKKDGRDIPPIHTNCKCTLVPMTK
jgi:hypothetical protein